MIPSSCCCRQSPVHDQPGQVREQGEHQKLHHSLAHDPKVAPPLAGASIESTYPAPTRLKSIIGSPLHGVLIESVKAQTKPLLLSTFVRALGQAAPWQGGTLILLRPAATCKRGRQTNYNRDLDFAAKRAAALVAELCH